jgi:mannose-6-phosphate isomerase-like protein (cupin superfamily)
MIRVFEAHLANPQRARPAVQRQTHGQDRRHPVLDDPVNAYYITDIAPGRSVNPHFHCLGDEVYVILGGNGVIHTWDVEAPSSVESQAIGNGAVFRIPPKTAHRLENNGEEPLILLFACAPDHLGSDRFAVPSLVGRGAA